MEVSNPKRILAVSLEEEKHLLSQVVKDLTGTHPEPHPGTSSLAGTSHVLSLSTAYYKAEVPVWIDLIASSSSCSSSSAPEEWATSFTSPEAREVLDVLGGVVVVFPVVGASVPAPASSAPASGALPVAESTTEPVPASVSRTGIETGANKGTVAGATATTETQTPAATTATQQTSPTELIRQVGRVMEALGGWSWDGVGLGIGVGGTGDEADVFDDACAAVGLEFVHASSADPKDQKNEFGETIGLSRALEALQANDWTLTTSSSLSSSLLSNHDDEFGDFENATTSLSSGDCSGGSKDNKTEANADESLIQASTFGPPAPPDTDTGSRSRKKNKDNDDFDPESLDFGFDKKDYEGLRRAIWGGGESRSDVGDDDQNQGGDNNKDKRMKKREEKDEEADKEMRDIGAEDVEKLDRMMGKLLAVRDMSAGLPEEQRKRMAKRAVGEVMREL